MKVTTLTNKRKIRIMHQLENKNRTSLFWVLNISGWILLFLIYVVLYYRKSLDNYKVILALFITYASGFFISLLLHYFYKKINYQSRSILIFSVIIVFGSLIASNIWLWIDVLLSIPLQGAEQLKRWLAFQYYISSVYSHLWVLLLWSTLYFIIKLWHEWAKQKGRTEKANALAQAAQLQMLRYQLNPHFLFNALNSIRALIDEDKKVARKVITELSEFLRYTLISKNYSDVPLNSEIQAIKHYFSIEKIRYEDKLEVYYDIEPEAEEYPVLSFLIHPLVENAIKYGMQTSKLPLKIWLTAAIENDKLIFEIINTGKWVDPDSQDMDYKNSTGTGLKNVRKRLENAFPDNHFFIIEEKDDKVCIRLEIKSN